MSEEVLILSRAVHFASCLLLLSIFVVRLLVERPAADDGRASRLLAHVCLAVAMGSGFLWLWATVAGMSGSSLMDSLNPQLFRIVIGQTPPGHVWIVRFGIGVLLGALLCFRRGRWSFGLIPAAVFVGSLAWLGHAGADGRTLNLAADVAHLLAAAAWPAGLLPFVLLLRRHMQTGTLAAAHAAARRFSALSLVTVVVLVASGLVNAFFLVGSFHALVATDYGRLLMLKLALFAIALTLGAWNLLVLEPRIGTAPEALAAMARNVWIEATLGTLIVLVVAILGTLPPASTFAG